MIDVLGHFFYAWIMLGMILLSQKNKWGWAARLVGELGWVGLGWTMGMTSIWIWGSIFVLIDLCGFLYWYRKEIK